MVETSPSSSSNSYSRLMGFVFLFNLMVGNGSLTLPRGFAHLGIESSLLVLVVIACTSHLTATFVLELMAGVNAILRYHIISLKESATPAFHKKNQEIMNEKRSNTKLNSPTNALLSSFKKGKEVDTESILFSSTTIEEDLNNTIPKFPHEELFLNDIHKYRITKKVEIAEMADLLLPTFGKRLCQFTLILYLYGDLAIQSVSVPKALRELTCPQPGDETPWLCVKEWSSNSVYRMYLLFFAIGLGPLVAGDLQKTRWIQWTSVLIRMVSVFLMVSLAFFGRWDNTTHATTTDEPSSVIGHRTLPTFVGIAVYTFMCHHSFPSMLTPVDNKRRLSAGITTTYMIVFLVNILLCLSAMYRFAPNDISDIYSVNFEKYAIVGPFLGLYPVFINSASFPLIGITLRETLKSVYRGSSDSKNTQTYNLYFALLTLLPPFGIALLTENVSLVVGMTGAYAGIAIQWIIPSVLVYQLRKKLVEMGYSPKENPFRSSFCHNGWILFTLILSIIVMCLVTISMLSD